MPIEIDETPAQAVVVTTQDVSCNRLYMNTLLTDGGTYDGTKPPSAEIVATPYREVEGEPVVFANSQKKFQTRDLNAAQQNIPEIGPGMIAVMTALSAWNAYTVARQADLDAANGALAAQQTRMDQAKTALDAAGTARNTAFANRTAAEKAGADQATLQPLIDALTAADAAWQKADQDYEAAKAAVPSLKANVATAQAALDDPANPKLT